MLVAFSLLLAYRFLATVTVVALRRTAFGREILGKRELRVDAYVDHRTVSTSVGHRGRARWTALRPAGKNDRRYSGDSAVYWSVFSRLVASPPPTCSTDVATMAGLFLHPP